MQNQDIVTRMKVPFASDNYFSGNQMLLIQAHLNKKFKEEEYFYFINVAEFEEGIDPELFDIDIRIEDGINQLNTFIKLGTLTIKGVEYKCAYEIDDRFLSKIIITERIYNVFSALVPDILLERFNV